AALTRRIIQMRKQWMAAGFALLIGGTAVTHAQTLPARSVPPSQATAMFPGVSSTPAGTILTMPIQSSPGDPRSSGSRVIQSQFAAPASEFGGTQEPASRPEQLSTIEGEAVEPPKWGPTPPEDLRTLMDHGRFGHLMDHNGIRV